jgi:predicted exporter
MKASYRLALAALWLAVLIAAGIAISQRLQHSGDLRKFMPGRKKDRRAAVFKAARAAGDGERSAVIAVALWRAGTCA